MEARQLYYVSGTGRENLEACYRLLDLHLNKLPDNPDDFDIHQRHDGLVTYQGPHSIWEATVRITPGQVELLAESSAAEDVHPIG